MARSVAGRRQVSEWPGNGLFREAKTASPATVVFVHQYAGNRDSSRQHQDMVLAMGFNSFSFNLTPRLRDASIPIWADELGAVLDAVEGPKILYSFSFPSVSVPTLLARAPREDVKAWICDGGPFSEIWRCYWNLLTHFKIGHPIPRFFATSRNFFAAGGWRYDSWVRRNLALMQPLPILSIRNTQDPLVPMRAIDKFFALGGPELQPERLTIESRGHLDGLSVAPKIYTHRVHEFLASKIVFARP
ncbi:MAG: hypothetical protein KF799_03940 [Bdellovibrionales bacterium]|nr:hypothetical protein [Bdellovibrionales bacterium]